MHAVKAWHQNGGVVETETRHFVGGKIEKIIRLPIDIAYFIDNKEDSLNDFIKSVI